MTIAANGTVYFSFEDGYSTGRGYRLIGAALPPLPAGIMAVLAVAAATAWAAWRANPDYPDRSALIVVGDGMHALTSGANAYLPKPFDLMHLDRLITEAIGSEDDVMSSAS